MENMNTSRYLEDMRMQVLQILGKVSPPSVQIHTGQDGTTIIPPDAMDIVEDAKIEKDTQQDTYPDVHPTSNQDMMEQNSNTIQ